MHRNPLRPITLVDRPAYLAALCAGKRVLHLGATDSPHTEEAFAGGRLLHLHLAAAAGELVGLDLDADRVAWLREQGIENIAIGNIENPADYPGGLFDLIVAGEIFEHLDNPGRALDALRPCLGENARLVLSVPNAYSVKGFLRAVAGHEWIHPDHVLHHSQSTLRTLLGRHGFEPVEFFAYVNGGNGALAPLVNLALRALPQLCEGVGVVARPA